MSITSMIDDLNKLKNIDSEHLHGIYDFDELIESLKKLDEMVEMSKAKKTVCQQIKYLIVNKNNNDDEMLNAVILGQPGVGKTELAKILCRIWTSMGLLKQEKEVNLKESFSIMVSNFVYENHIEELSEKLEESQANLVEINTKIEQNKYDLNVLKENMERLRRKNKFITYRQENKIYKSLRNIKNNNKEIKEIISENVEIIPEINIEEARKSSLVAKKKNIQDNFKIVTREDFVAGFVGQTAIKTKNLLEKCKGMVIFIDEAYSLFNGGDGNDSFGMEALTAINEHMSRYPRNNIFIFAGYEDLMDKTIFKVQPGLKRRCMWTFNIDNYSPEGLSKIFEYQIKLKKWSLEKNNLHSFFDKYIDKFPEFGGDTEKLAYHCKLAYSSLKYNSIISGEKTIFDKIINEKILKEGFSEYLKHKNQKKGNKNLSYFN